MYVLNEVYRASRILDHLPAVAEHAVVIMNLWEVVACSLHLMMNTCRILLRELLRSIDFTPTLVDAFEKILKDNMGIHLDPTKKGLLSERVD